MVSRLMLRSGQVLIAAVVACMAVTLGSCHLFYPFEAERPASTDAAQDAAQQPTGDLRGEQADPPVQDLQLLDHAAAADAQDLQTLDTAPKVDTPPKPDAPSSPCLAVSSFGTKWNCMGGMGQCYAQCGGYTLDCPAPPGPCTCAIPWGGIKTCAPATGTDCSRCKQALAAGCCGP